MDRIGIINPQNGQTHYVPYEDLGAAMEAGGMFADEEQKQKAIQYQQMTESSIEPTPFNKAEDEFSGTLERPETTGWKGLKEDAIGMLKNMFKSGAGFTRRALPNLADVGSQFAHHPIDYPPHVAKQVLASLGEGAKGLLNLPHEVIAELGRKELIPEWLKKYNELPFTHIPEDTGVEKALGFEPTRKSDELLRALPALYGGGQLLKSPIKKGVDWAKSPSKDTLFQRALEEKIGEAKEAHNLSKTQVQELQDALTEQFSGEFGKKIGKTTPVGQKESINVKEAKIKELEPETKIPEEKIGELPPEPDTESLMKSRKDAAEAARKDAEQTLGSLDNPRLKAGATVQKAIKDVKKSSSDLYDSARKHYAEEKIVADNSKEIKAITSDLEELKAADELAPGYGSGTAEQKALESQINALKAEKVNATDVFDLQRTLEKMANDTRKKQYSGVNELEFKRLGGLAERLDNHAEKLAKRLEAVGGKEVQSMIKEANKGWKTYKDLEKNSVGRAALKKGEIPSRAMIDIANTQPGNEFLQALTESYPELKKNMLAAYTGESNVNKLMKPTTLTKKYLEALPEVEEKVQELKNAIAGVKEGETEARNIKKGYKELVNSMKAAADKQKVRQDAIKQSEQLKKEIKFHKEAIPKLEARIKDAEAKGLEHAKLDKELTEHKQKIQDKGGKLKEFAKLFAKVKLIGAAHL